MTFNKQMYQDALDSQTACNLSGLANALARHTKAIWDEAHELGKVTTDYVNKHPVVALFLHQMAYLNGANADLLGEDWSRAHRVCELRATDPIGVAEELVASVTALLRRESDCACSPAIFEPRICPHCAECKDRAIKFLGLVQTEDGYERADPVLAEDGYADGGEPYTDEELDIINKGL